MTAHSQDITKVEEGFRLILDGLGLDLDDAHLKDTPRRAAKAWFNELFAGLTGAAPQITTFPSKVGELVMLRHIPVRSLCAHHLLPFYGTATVGYIPGNDHILGLSKLSRIVSHWARRPQVQEQLTGDIANHVWELVRGKFESNAVAMDGGNVSLGEAYTGGVGVIVRATHMCMMLRGVNHSGEMTTSAMRGTFFDNPTARAEFLHLDRGA